jgi:hypothetical protein
MKRTLIAIAAFTSICLALAAPGAAQALDGDINGDCNVNMLDLQLVGNRYGATWGSLRYSSHVDLNGDRRIDIVDLQMVAAHFGESC